jgi:hypothetical protein
MARPLRPKVRGDAQMAARLDEERIALAAHRREMADRPDGDADQPEAQAQADRAGERAVHDGDGARRAAEQDRLGERPMKRDGIAGHVSALIDDARHQTSAPPPNEKKDRKKSWPRRRSTGRTRSGSAGEAADVAEGASGR